MLWVDAAHGLHHLFAQFHRRRQELGTTFEDVAKIDVKEFARFGQHIRLSRCQSPTSSLLECKRRWIGYYIRIFKEIGKKNLKNNKKRILKVFVRVHNVGTILTCCGVYNATIPQELKQRIPKHNGDYAPLETTNQRSRRTNEDTIACKKKGSVKCKYRARRAWKVKAAWDGIAVRLGN